MNDPFYLSISVLEKGKTARDYHEQPLATAKNNQNVNVKCNTITIHTSSSTTISYSTFDSSKAIADILSFRCCEPKGINTPLNHTNQTKNFT